MRIALGALPLGLFVVGLAVCRTGFAADIDECRNLMLRGRYAESLAAVTKAIDEGVYGESWQILKVELELRQGKYDEALATVQIALTRYAYSIRLRWKGIEAARFAGQPDLEKSFLEEFGKNVQGTPWRYTDVENLVTLAEFALAQGADAKDVQDAFLQRARRNNPLSRSPILALGNLALEKRDFQLAADIFRPAVESHPDDPEMHFGLARALVGSDSEQASQLLSKTLELNPHHLEALLWQADRLIDGERYDAAIEKLEQVTAVNSKHPEALALLSVIAELQSQPAVAEQHRETALSTWEKNPQIDYVIGRKLSQKYRFLEGSQRQRQALEFDENYLPARKQLAQDLLRLGREEEGWQLADAVHRADQYDVSIYNLVTLRDELERFTTLEADGLIVRMDPHEAAIYGERVVVLLVEAKERLCEKYHVELTEPVLVEIFPRPADFAVRTFGMPAAGGYLGVCFGNVVTANSPASQAASPVNWESVLWHEFAHVVTLNKTRNRMPRWLSEGISVHEERQRNPSWGEQMTATYRDMILGGELTPVGELSNAFLSPKTPLHLQFAYFQSSLVVEYLVNNFGSDAVLSILDDLAVGMAINETLERHTVPIRQLEEEFEKFARLEANAYGTGVDWAPVDLTEQLAAADPVASLVEWAREHPHHYRGLKACATALLRLQREEQAKMVLQRMIELFPHDAGASSPLPQLADLHRKGGETDQEYELLARYAAISGNASGTYQRLIEIETERENWSAVERYAGQLMAVNPLVAAPHAALARVAESRSDAELAIPALSALLRLDPNDAAGLHYRLARQHQHLGQSEQARRHVLRALEEAPRFRDALSLLLELQSAAAESSGGL